MMIFNSFIKPCVLPTEFHHGRGKMIKGSSISGNPPTYEFCNPSFVARQFGLGQLPPCLFFKNILKPREDISDVLEASRVFRLGLDLPSFSLHDWVRVSFSSSLFDSWWQDWCSHLFCGSVHPLCIALDREFASDSEVTFHSLFWEIILVNSLANCPKRPFQDIDFDPPSLDRRGRSIDYQPPCPVSRMGSTAPFLKQLMRTHAAPTIMTCQSPKRKAILGAT